MKGQYYVILCTLWVDLRWVYTGCWQAAATLCTDHCIDLWLPPKSLRRGNPRQSRRNRASTPVSRASHLLNFVWEGTRVKNWLAVL